MSQPRANIAFDEPIVRESVAEMVARRILDMVSTRVLRPGDQLPPERELAEQLGVSRPSVREAFRGLAILGVVRSRQGAGPISRRWMRIRSWARSGSFSVSRK